MKITPLNMTDPWFSRLNTPEDSAREMLRDVPVTQIVHMETVTVLHKEVDEGYRPYLHLHGGLSRVLPDTPLPFGIDELSFVSDRGPVIDAFYEMDREQLATLVAKGYFEPGFAVPVEMTDIDWDLPGTANFLIIPPELVDDVPLVFMQTIGQSDRVLTLENSGHDLVQYFPDRTSEQVGTDVTRITRDIQRSASYRDSLFQDADFTTPAQRKEAAAVALPTPQPAVSVFDQMAAGTLSQQEAEHAAMLAARKEVDGRNYPESLYARQVAPHVQEALNIEEQAQGHYGVPDNSEKTGSATAYDAQRVEPDPRDDDDSDAITPIIDVPALAAELGVVPMDTGNAAKQARRDQQIRDTRAAAAREAAANAQASEDDGLQLG